MSNLVSCWEKCMSIITPLKAEDVEMGRRILNEDSFTEFLQYCKEKGCFPTDVVYTLVRYDVSVYEIDGNYEEEDYDRKEQLLNIIFINE